ncbi:MULTISPECIES: hypothetical protein [Sphingomonas]|uniref:Uncharacterized protein n=1 Tax=Sphingomonas adhaesiva TaxID=28212 RepID=A0A2A4IAK8_9SPHN|nr:MULTISPECIES: hypothetical protein [Sphingomonas]PCG15178.1 hypothetical protein COA07_06470 [Sphingomonas adhaesiva]PZU79971.1 MAG: hypothetical protein DI530_07230 [Sphingomonas sp.]
MVATLPPNRPESGLNATLLPVAAILAGIGVAAGIATAPGDVLNAVVMRSHLPDWVPAAAPPIGVTGRTLLALVAGALVMMAGLGAAGWWRLPRRRRADPLVPAIRRADAHPDAPPRRPIRASEDLGQPLPDLPEPVEVLPVIARGHAVADDADPIAPANETPPAAWLSPPPERPLPRDLNLPMSVFDPGAVPSEPMEAPRPLPPLVMRATPAAPTSAPADVEAAEPVPPPPPPPPPVRIAPGERMESFALPPVPLSTTQLAQESLASLVDRLERGAARRALPLARPAQAAAHLATLDDTLQRLRRLAAG